VAIVHYRSDNGAQEINTISKKQRSMRAGTKILAVIVVASMLHLFDATKAFSQSPAMPAHASLQSPSGAAPTHLVRTPAEEKALNELMNEPRNISAAIVGADIPAPKYVVMIGAHHGEYLEVFLDRFPTARALWTEPNNTEGNMPVAKERLARFGNRVDFKFGCGERDISDGCVPKGADVIITDWVSILQNLDGMYKIYKIANEQLAPGGWFVNIDQVSFDNGAWDSRIRTARKGFRPEHEWPPVHHVEFRTPTIDEQLGAMRAAGFDAQVVWQSFSTVLFMGRKK
jgi:hypothetical protein